MIVLPETKLNDIYDVTATYRTINNFLYECVYEYRVPMNGIFVCYHRTMQYTRRTDMWNDINDTLWYCSTKFYAHVKHVEAE